MTLLKVSHYASSDTPWKHSRCLFEIHAKECISYIMAKVFMLISSQVMSVCRVRPSKLDSNILVSSFVHGA
eukprot:c3376_g1_i1 orf=72-284(+)